MTDPNTNSNPAEGGESLLGGGTPPTETKTETPPTEQSKQETTAEVKYEFKGAPEGYDTKELEAFAKDLGVTPEKAQKLLDRELARDKQSSEALDRDFKKTVEVDWVNEIKTDPKLGGDKFAESKAIANRAWDVVPNELKQELFKYNLQNNPALFKIMHHLGNSMREGKFVRAGEQANTELPSTQKFYGK